MESRYWSASDCPAQIAGEQIAPRITDGGFLLLVEGAGSDFPEGFGLLLR